MQKEAIILAGPTAVGKTAEAIRLALLYDTEILSADSRQCFRELEIGVAKPTSEELQQVRHHFINSHSIHDKITAASYESYALKALDDIFSRRDKAIVVGGTGLYIRALMQGLDDMPAVPEQIRQTVAILYQREGLEGLQAAIRKEDPLFLKEGDIDNPRRVMRALEIIRTSGKSIRYFQQRTTVERPFTMKLTVMQLPREELYARINQRVDRMMEQGLLEEVRSLLPYRHLNALQTVGYRELFEYMDGACSLEDAVAKIKQHTRHYAKRQMTWWSDSV
jgi:tRNA dimethylallyltransferase